MDAIRKAFEEWAAPKHFDLKRSLLNSEGYFDCNTELAWEGFKAAIDLILEPDWSNAPERMQYHAIDSTGHKYWHEEKPKELITKWISRCFENDPSFPFWRESLRQRPEPPKKEWWDDVSEKKPILVKGESGLVYLVNQVLLQCTKETFKPLTDKEIDLLKRGF